MCCSTSTGRGRSRSAIRPSGLHTLSIFILPPSIAELKRRLIARGQDGEDVIQKRMQKSWDEISHWDGYDYVLINDDLDATEQRLRTIVAAERMRAPTATRPVRPCAPSCSRNLRRGQA